jgi:lysyl-tRNA synthetase class 2
MTDVPVDGWPEESAQRLDKAMRLRALGVEPYPTRYPRTHGLAEVTRLYGDKGLEELETLAVPVRVAGRVVSRRAHGKASFATLSDGEEKLQVYLRQDDLGERAYALFGELVDEGDHIGVAGTVMRTRKGELSVQARELAFLSKALLPPPASGTASPTWRRATASATST